MLWFGIVALIVIFDRITKVIALERFESPVTVIDRFFYLTHTENTGAAWGIFQNGRFFFIPLTIIISGILVYILYKSKVRILNLSISFILGGALGNLIDRIWRGSVTDFLDFYFGSYNFPTFNIADSFVVVGTIFLAYFLLFKYEDSEKAGESREHP